MVTDVPSLSSTFEALKPGGFFRQYQLLEQIGIGGQAVVWSAVDSAQNCIYAIKFNKILDSDENMPEEIGLEPKLEILVKLQHAHILPLHEYGSEERLRYAVSPYIPGGTLATKIRTAPLSFAQVLRYGAEIASALDYLHRQGVIHRDLKTSNILLDLSDHTYLADFGLARILSVSTVAFHTGHGTPPYAPPEQIRSKEITSKSDIFSFGILLFEMFTGQLPWGGKRQLGVEQLHSAEELPDPREYVPGLPPRITDVLRRVTSADPDLRPRSASEVMRMIHYLFNLPFESLPDDIPYDEATARNRDTDEILKHGLAQWESSKGRLDLGLTRFALIDLQRKRLDTELFRRFMLSHALTYGYQAEEWWSRVSEPREKLLVSSAMLAKGNEAIAARVLKHLLNDSNLMRSASTSGVPKNLVTSLLAMGTRTNDSILRQQIFFGIQALVRPGKTWKDPALDPDQLRRLGELALEDSQAGDRAAELIGHLHSPSAVREILSRGDEDRKIAVLLLVQQVAGSLPSFVPPRVRFQLILEWILQRLTQQPVGLISAYMMAFLGAALGISLQVYVTYNLPDFLDITRVATSLEQGLIVGSVLGLGVFLTRLIVERFDTSSAALRILPGTILGGLGINIALLIFHILFLSTPPSGFLISLGSLVIALTFAVGGLIRRRFIKMLLATLSVLGAILSTWWIHINFATSSVDLTPMLRYDYSWPFAQVALTALGVSLLIGILGNLISLSIRDE